MRLHNVAAWHMHMSCRAIFMKWTLLVFSKFRKCRWGTFKFKEGSRTRCLKKKARNNPCISLRFHVLKAFHISNLSGTVAVPSWVSPRLKPLRYESSWKINLGLYAIICYYICHIYMTYICHIWPHDNALLSKRSRIGTLSKMCNSKL